MTEPLDPTDLGAPAGSDAARDATDRAWFRAHLDPIVDPMAEATDRVEVEPGWPALAASVAAAEAPQPLTTASRRPHAWVLGAAAVVVALLAFASVVALTRDDDPSEPLATVPEDPTGWYVPSGLPDGWELQSVEAYPGQEACERKGSQWTDPEGDRSVGVWFDACGTAPTEADVPNLEIPGAPPDLTPMASLREVELPNGQTATGVTMADEDPTSLLVDRSLGWNAEEGGAWTVRAIGLDVDQLVDVASRLAEDPDTSTLGIDGLDRVQEWTAPARDRTPEVQVNLVNPRGLAVSYHLALPGDGVGPAGSSVLVPVTIDGQPNPIFRYDSLGFWAGRYGGSWPGADIIFYRWTQERTDSEHLITDDEIEGLIAALRPATVGEWRQFLATATGAVSPVLLEAESLTDLAAADFERPGEPDPDAVATTTQPDDGTPEDTTTTEPNEPADTGPVESEPVTVPGGEGTDRTASLSDLAGLRIRLRLSSTRIGVTESTPAELVFENPTDETIVVNECSSLLTTWGLVPADDPTGELPDRLIIDCYDTPTVTIAGGETETMPLEWGAIESGLTARGLLDAAPGLEQTGGTLPAGDYLAVARIPTRTGDIQLTIPVTIDDPPCPMTDDEATRYRNLPYAEAEAAVTSDRRSLVPVWVDGEPRGTDDDLRCDRVRAVVMDNQVIDYTFG